MNILLVDDEERSRFELADFLRQIGHKVTEKADGYEALNAFLNEAFHLVLTDNRMPGISGMELLRKIRVLPRGQDVNIVMFTGYGDMQTAIEAMRAGAYDYLLKPINIEELVAVTERVAEQSALKRENQISSVKSVPNVPTASEASRPELSGRREDDSELIGVRNIGFFSPAMTATLELAKKLHACESVPVLIEGETGTGKEVIARIIHFGNDNMTNPFVALNCAAITPSVFESELFGYEGGAFTGALNKGQKGKLDLASGGTLFLDEITEMPVELQAKLLRVLQEKEFYRVGGLKLIKADVRIIAATNHRIENAVAQGSFRRDLFYRLNVGRIFLPPLRERTEDIIPLASMFLAEFADEQRKHVMVIGKKTASILLSYQWPGNIRELRNAMQRAVLMWDDTELQAYHLDLLLESETGIVMPNISDSSDLDLSTITLPSGSLPIEQLYNDIILKALEMHRGNKTATAQYLCISRNSLLYRLKHME